MCNLIAHGALRKVALLGLIFCLLTGGCRPPGRGATPAESDPLAASETTRVPQPTALATALPVVVDTDVGLDDLMALLYLLPRPDVTIAAITVAGTGLAHCEPGTRAVLGLIALTEAGDIPVACGRELPLQGTHTFPESWRADADRWYGLTLPQGGAVAEETAVELLIASIEAAPTQVVVLALGPYTNIAEVLQHRPELGEKVAMIYSMGGALDVPGNLGESDAGRENRVAEWNLYIDPHAAGVVLESGIPITLIPLDATNDVPITSRFYEALNANHTVPAANGVHELLSKNPHLMQGGFFFWDPLAAVLLTDESVATLETAELTIVEAEGPESSRTARTDNGATVRVAVSADRARFEQIFLATLVDPGD